MTQMETVDDLALMHQVNDRIRRCLTLEAESEGRRLAIVNIEDRLTRANATIKGLEDEVYENEQAANYWRGLYEAAAKAPEAKTVPVTHHDYGTLSGEPRPFDKDHGVPGDTPCKCGGIAWYHGAYGCDDCPCKHFEPAEEAQL